MTNDLQVFQNQEFGQVRTILIDGQPWFVGKDVADALGYSNSRKAIADHVDADDKGVTKQDTLGGVQEMVIINESGLYSLILGSQLPSAKKFKRWVTNEVLPAIRGNGGFVGNDDLFMNTYLPFANEQTRLLFKSTLEAVRCLNCKIEMDKPKVIFADAVSASKSCILVGELAKLIKQNGVDMGQKRLFEWLRQNNYLIKRNGTDYNMPTQKSMELGLFQIKETSIVHSDGHTSICKTSKVTGAGQQYFINKFLI